MMIDWSKAPVGTTGAMVAEFNGATVRRGDVEWIPSSSTQKDCYSVGRGSWVYHEAPPKWNGEGLPPVGAELEAGFAFEDFEKWHKGVCIAVGECPEGREEFCVVRFGKKIAMYTMAHGRMRPIRTAEQIAADEKRADIEAIVAAFRYTAGQCTHCLPYSSAERLYEIGVRLQVAP